MKKFLFCLIILTAIAVPESFAQETTSTTTTDLPLARLHVTDLNSGISRIFYLSNNDSPLLINLESGTYSILYVADENEYEGILNLY